MEMFKGLKAGRILNSPTHKGVKKMKFNNIMTVLSFLAMLGVTACVSDNATSSDNDDVNFSETAEPIQSPNTEDQSMNYAEPTLSSSSETYSNDIPQIDWNNLMSQMSQSSSSISAIDPSTVIKSSFTDSRDNQTYRTVTIGAQTWMAENLNYKMTGSKVVTTADGYAKYGQFYNWNAAMQACPSGWHLPSYDDYKTLFGNVGPTGVVDVVKGAETVEGRVLKSTSDEWYGAASGGACAGTDTYGFAALPADYDNEGLDYHAQKAFFWSYQAIYTLTKPYVMQLYWNECKAELASWSEDAFFSVRCLKD